MKQKTASTKKKATKAAAKPKTTWAETMKKALQNKQAPGGFPEQPKPRDSNMQKVRKNAF